MGVRYLADASGLLDSIDELPPERPAPRVTLPAPMLRYACNQQGCCCGGWKIAFTPKDLVRLGRALPPEERERLLQGVEVREELSDDGTPTITNAYLVDDSERCRFLAQDGKQCGVHARTGVEALPDVCVDFPVAAYETPEGAEFVYDPVCPSVLDALVEGDATAAIVSAPYADDSFRRRASHAKPFPTVRVGATSLTPEQFAGIRRKIVLSLEGRSVVEHLFAVDAAYAEVGNGEKPPEAFSLRYDRDAALYQRFFDGCLAEHKAGTLASVFQDYRRFVFAIPHDPRSAAWDELEKHLHDWRPAFEHWLQPSMTTLLPIHLRYLAHRHFGPFLSIQGRLHFSAGAITHSFATALRYAAAFGAVFRKPVDADMMKAAIGAGEYVHRALEIQPESLPWFGLLT